MNPRTTKAITAALVVASSIALNADRVRPRSGKVVEGVFLGADSRTVRVLLDNGSVTEVSITDTVAVEFAARKPQPPPAAEPSPAAAPPHRVPPPGRRQRNRR